MKNHWIQLYEMKKNRWWTIDFMRNGMFLLKPRRVSSVQSSALGPDSDVKTEFSTILHFAPADHELLDFINEAQKSMSNIYSRVRLMQGVHPFMIEIENYELTALTYGSVLPAGKFTLMRFIFYFEHLRYTKIH